MRSRPSISARCSTSVGQIGDLAVARAAAVRVDVLPEQRDLPDTLVDQVGDLGQHVVERPRHFLAAGVGNDAERAVLAAALHDRHECRDPVDPGRRQMVELLDLGKADVDLRLAGRAPARDQLGQAVQRLRAEDHVDVGCARDDRRAFLAGDAAADADDQVRIRILQRAHAPEVMEHALLRLFAHRAGVEQDDVGVVRPGGRLEALGRVQHVGHLGRVVLVHLTAKRADVQLAAHG